MQDFTGYKGIEEAARAVVDYLQATLGLGMVAFTRKTDDHQVFLQVADRSYGVEPGDSVVWSESVCSRMLDGLGPRMATDLQGVPAYASAEALIDLEAGSYFGVPVNNPDGSVFGVLCGLDPEMRPPEFAAHEGMLTIFSKLLSTVLAHELEKDHMKIRAARAEAEATKDPLTGVLNRRGWDSCIAETEARCRRFGDPASVLVVDLDGFKYVNDTHGHPHGDAVLQKAADALTGACRGSDLVARIGGDEFAVLATGCASGDAEMLYWRVTEALRRAGVEASVGVATRHPDSDLYMTVNEADVSLYERKTLRRAAG
jgi:diguanylate cyclase